MSGYPNFCEYPTRDRVLQAQIDVTDREIDQLVYQLYGLTEEDIKVLEWVE